MLRSQKNINAVVREKIQIWARTTTSEAEKHMPCDLVLLDFHKFALKIHFCTAYILNVVTYFFCDSFDTGMIW